MYCVLYLQLILNLISQSCILEFFINSHTTDVFAQALFINVCYLVTLNEKNKQINK